MEFWRRVKSGFEIPQPHVEFNEAGFAIKLDRWYFGKSKRERLIPWSEVSSIYIDMWDCFLCHMAGLQAIFLSHAGIVKKQSAIWR